MATANGGRAAETAERDQLAAANVEGGDAEMAVCEQQESPPPPHKAWGHSACALALQL